MSLRSRQFRLEQLEQRNLLTCTACPLQFSAHASSEVVTLASSDLAGNTPAQAYRLGNLSGTQTLIGSAGLFDQRDFLKFSVASDTQVELVLDHLFADLDLYLYDSLGHTVDRSVSAGRTADNISATLAPGEYYVLVAPYQWASSSYRLTLSAGSPATAPVPVPMPAPAPANPAVPNPAQPAQPVQVFPDVPYYGGAQDWNLNAVNAPEAWNQGFTGTGVTIAIVDTGVDVAHPDLDDNIWRNVDEIAGDGIDNDHNGYVDDLVGWNFVDQNADVLDGNGHGTHVAGTIAAERNGFGATGVAYDARIMPIRVLGDDGSGSTQAIAQGIRYAVDNGANIINLSLGGSFSYAIRTALDYALSHDVLVVAAAGNSGTNAPSYPARHSSELTNTISVGAYDRQYQLAQFSNRADGTSRQVDAPGVGVYSTLPGNRYGSLSGTSMAAPHVAGVAALMLSSQPNLAVRDLAAALVVSTDRIVSGSNSQGGVNAARAVARALYYFS